MYRTAIEHLLRWKELPSKRRKPMLLKGARQVGKTWLMKELGKYFDRAIYANLENDKAMREAFLDGDEIRDADDILDRIGKLAGAPLQGGGTDLLILDELQTVPNGMSRLKYLPEVMPDLRIIAAGSLLGISWGRRIGYMGEPVGCYRSLSIYPLTFQEFLFAIDEIPLARALYERNWQAMHDRHLLYLEKMLLYFAIGGMPEAVDAYISEGLHAVSSVHKELLAQYSNDFSKRMYPEDARSAISLWQKMQTYIGKRDPKALFGRLRQEPRMPHGEKVRDFVQWFSDAGLILRLWRVNQAEHGLGGYRVDDEIKAYSFDIGILGAMLKIPLEDLLYNEQFRGKHLGTLAEQFVMQELVASDRSDFIGYWNSPIKDLATGKKKACEVDFLLNELHEVIPIEVKSTSRFASPSFDLFRKAHPEYRHAVRLSLKNFGISDNLWALPLYAVSTIGDFLKEECMPWNLDEAVLTEESNDPDSNDESLRPC